MKIERIKKIDDKNASVKYWAYSVESKLLEIYNYIESGKKGVKTIQDKIVDILDDTKSILTHSEEVENEVFEILHGESQ